MEVVAATIELMSRLTYAFVCAAFFATCLVAQDEPKLPQQPDTNTPVISADLGDCTADITVTGSKLKPIYNAKIATQIKYGFAGFHRLNLEIYTNADGQARFEGLPERPRAPLSFDVTYQGRSTAVIVHP